jgi:hypothetical protein
MSPPDFAARPTVWNVAEPVASYDAPSGAKISPDVEKNPLFAGFWEHSASVLPRKLL